MARSLSTLLSVTMPLLLAGQAVSAQAPAKKPDHWTIIHAGTLLADADKPAQKNVSIIIKNDKIESIQPGQVGAEAAKGAAPGSVKMVELGDKFVMAGLIDAHTHSGGGGFGGPAGFPGAFETVRDRVLNGATTVRDLSSPPEIIFPVRDTVLAGLAVGPRIVAAGSGLSATGGHGDPRNGRVEISAQPAAYTSGVCDGPDDCMRVARLQIMMTANVVKIMATSGVLDNSDTGLEQQFTDEELKAIVSAVHFMKRKVAAHAIGQEGIKAAVKAGVDSIEHGNYLDDEGARLMKEHGTWLVPTLSVIYNSYLRATNPPPGSPPLSENSKAKIMRLPEAANPKNLGNQVRIAQRAGVKIAVGTDTGRDVKEELVDLVKFGGMSIKSVLSAATVGNADLLGISNEAGTIAPGKSADIVAFDADPTSNIDNVRKLNFVMARGSVVRTGGAVPF